MQHYTWIAEPLRRAKSLRQCIQDRQNATERMFCCTLKTRINAAWAASAA
jgi:hypothetical protein